jgi:3-oxoacyl-[acyl-carrier protein] reductase
MDLHLKGKRAIVLGGSRGIGRAIADTLAAEGASVGICARNADQVTEAVAALKAKACVLLAHPLTSPTARH